MIGHEVQDQAHATRRQCLTRAGEAVRSTEMIIDNIATYAVRRPDDICCLPIRKSLSEARPQARVRQGDGDARGTALPDAHQPDCVESKIAYFIPVAIGNRSKIDSCFLVPADCLKPRPGVDLVERRVGDLAQIWWHGRRSGFLVPSRLGPRRSWTHQELSSSRRRRSSGAPGGVGRAADQRPGRSSRFDVWRRGPRRCRRGSTR